MSDIQRTETIMRIGTLEELASMRRNVTARNGLTEQLVSAFRQREFELYQQKVADRLQRDFDTLKPVELKIVCGLAALWMTHERNLPPNRSFQALRNRGGNLIKFAEDVVSNGLESNGYRRLTAAGFSGLVFERVVLDHSEVFSEKARTNAQRRLLVLEEAVTDQEIDASETEVRKDTYATKGLLAELGFEKPQPTSWYALRGDEIVFLSWIHEADFECNVARILADDGDVRPNFYHWRSQIQKIRAGDYRNAYIVFGNKGPGGVNVQYDSTLRVYEIAEIQEIGAEAFAKFVSVDSPRLRTDVAGGTIKEGEERPAVNLQFTSAPIRPEQAAFRRALFERFNGRCAITGCAVAELLDAAHLPGRRWELGHNGAEDGILLRTDLHRALDTGLIRLDENLKVIWMAPSIEDLYRDLASAWADGRMAN